MKIIAIILSVCMILGALRILWLSFVRSSRFRFRSAMINIKRDMFKDPELYGIFDDVEPYIRKRITEKPRKF